MRAAWYEHRGPAREHLGGRRDARPTARPRRGADRCCGLRDQPWRRQEAGHLAGRSTMSFPRVIPHSDGAGTIDAVGAGRRWCPRRRAGVVLRRPVLPTVRDRRRLRGRSAGTRRQTPDSEGDADDLDEQASCLGIAGITAHRAVFADGSVDGLVVMVHGAVGGVGSIAAQLARARRRRGHRGRPRQRPARTSSSAWERGMSSSTTIPT